MKAKTKCRWDFASKNSTETRKINAVAFELVGLRPNEDSSANAVRDYPDQDPQLEKPDHDQSVERRPTTTANSTPSVRDIQNKTPSQAQCAARNEADDLKEIIQELRASFTEFRAEAKDREARYLTKIRFLTEKVSSLESVFEIKRNWWSPKLKAVGPGALPRKKNSNLRWLNPLKFNSDSFSYSTENCRRLFPVLRMIFTSLMTLKVKNKTWISNFQVHLQAQTNLPFQFMFKISSSASTEKS